MNEDLNMSTVSSLNYSTIEDQQQLKTDNDKQNFALTTNQFDNQINYQMNNQINHMQTSNQFGNQMNDRIHNNQNINQLNSQLNSTQSNNASLNGSFVHPNVQQQMNQARNHFISQRATGSNMDYLGRDQHSGIEKDENQAMHQSVMPNASVYSPGYNQVQSYPYTNYPQFNEHQFNYSSYNPQYPIASHVMSNTINTNAHQFAARSTAQFNHHLNSSLHQPHSIDLNDSLSRSFNGVPSNFAILNPPPLLQALPMFAQNIELTAQMTSWLADYNQWHQTVKRNLNQVKNQNLVPFKFEKIHSSIRFGNSNQFITVKGKSIFLQNVKSHLIETGERTLINTWPGPLIKPLPNNNLANNDLTNKNDVIEYIKGQEKLIVTEDIKAEYFYLNAEKSQIWQLLSMMIKQSGDLSSSELAEFLISKNESEFYTDDGGSDLGKFRRFLLLGQKKNALEYSRKTGLWGHSFALAYLISSSHFNETMIKQVNDFTDATLSKEDPIFTLYRRLLQNFNKNNFKSLNSICTVLPPSNLQQFTILLANNCEISPHLPGSEFTSEVLKLIVALRDAKSNFIDLNALENYFLRTLIKADTKKYSEELLFMNEIFEFCQKPNLPIIEIIPFKMIFAAKLYDYGLIDQARKYCEIIKNVRKIFDTYTCFDNKKQINWRLIMYMIELIESKTDKVLNDQTFEHNFLTTPSSQQEEEESSQSVAEEDESEQNEINQLDYELDDLNLNNELSNQQQSNKFSINRIDRNQPQQYALNQQQKIHQQQQINHQQQFQQQQTQKQQTFNNQSSFQQQINRERSDSLQSRQRTVSRTSSNQSNFATNKPETSLPSQNKFNPTSIVKTNDLPNLSNAQTVNMQPTSNLQNKSVIPPTSATNVTPYLSKPQKNESKQNQSQQTSYFVPKFSPSDNLPPPIDFISVSKPPIEPTNLLEEKEGNQNDLTMNNSDKRNSISQLSSNPQFNQTSVANFNPSFNSNFNSTLNPPIAQHQTSQTSQNYVFSPAVSPITSPVLNNQTRASMRSDDRKQQENKKLDTSSLDQTDSDLQSQNKPGLLSWVKNKIVPKTNEAHLPDDSKERFVYDHTLNTWIDLEDKNSSDQNQLVDQIKAGPPKIPVIGQAPPMNQTINKTTSNFSTGSNLPSSGPPTSIDPNQYSFTRNKQRRYVDILQQQN